jgi:Flp pilus assembly protein TadD
MNRISVALFCLMMSAALRGEEAAPAAETPGALRARAETLMRKDKKSPEPWVLLGRAALAEGRYGKALKAFQKALKRDPHSAEAYFGRGQVFEKKGKLDEAANEYQAARMADPGHAGAKEAWKRLSASQGSPVEN